MDKVVKWMAFFSILSAVLMVAFNEFMPKYLKWREDFPPEPESDITEPVSDAGTGLVDPVSGGKDFFERETFRDVSDRFDKS
jgi:hypothetical protein